MPGVPFIPLADFYQPTTLPAEPLRPSMRAFLGPLHIDAEARMAAMRCAAQIIELSSKTRTGRILLTDTMPERPLFALDPVMEPMGCFQRPHERFPIVRVQPGCQSVMTITFNHELQHLWQEINQSRVFRNHRHFEATASRYGDKIYYPMVREADSFIIDGINAYELKSLGKAGAWRHLHFGYERVMGAALKRELKQGKGLYSDEMKTALFHTWMTNDYSPRLSAGYEPRYLNWLLHLLRGDAPLRPGITQDSDLKCIVQDRRRHSYLDHVNIFKSEYVGVAACAKSSADLAVAAAGIDCLSQSVCDTLYVNQVLEKLEDAIFARKRLTGLFPEYDPVAAPATLEMGQFEETFAALARYGCETSEPLGTVETRVPTLIERCGRLADAAEPPIALHLHEAAQRAEQCYAIRSQSPAYLRKVNTPAMNLTCHL